MELRIIPIHLAHHLELLGLVYIIKNITNVGTIIQLLQPAKIFIVGFADKQIERGCNVANNDLRTVVFLDYLPPSVIKQDTVAILPTIVTRETERIIDDLWVIMMNGTRGAENQEVFMHAVSNIIMMFHIPTCAMLRHIRKGVARHTVYNKQEGKENDYL